MRLYCRLSPEDRRRRYWAIKAMKIGFGGIAYGAAVLGMRRRTIYTGIAGPRGDVQLRSTASAASHFACHILESVVAPRRLCTGVIGGGFPRSLRRPDLLDQCCLSGGIASNRPNSEYARPHGCSDGCGICCRRSVRTPHRPLRVDDRPLGFPGSERAVDGR
jgi:hypothetical protein